MTCCRLWNLPIGEIFPHARSGLNPLIHPRTETFEGKCMRKLHLLVFATAFVFANAFAATAQKPALNA